MPDTFPRWRPGGKSILHESGEGESAGLYETALDGKTSYLVLAKAFFGSYSPDGHQIVAIHYVDGPSKKFMDRAFSLVIANSDGSNERQLILDPPPS